MTSHLRILVISHSLVDPSLSHVGHECDNNPTLFHELHDNSYSVKGNMIQVDQIFDTVMKYCG